MGIETTAFERAIHLLLFVAGGIAFAVGALAVLERAAGGETPAVRWAYVAVAGATFGVLAAIEAIFHVLH